MKKGTFFSYARLNSRLSRYFLLCILLMIFNTDSCVSNNFSSNSIAFQANIKKFYVFFVVVVVSPRGSGWALLSPGQGT